MRAMPAGGAVGKREEFLVVSGRLDPTHPRVTILSSDEALDDTKDHTGRIDHESDFISSSVLK